ncbi:hypothetical protein Tco_0910694 [Tanacetum coccineum]|uniref:Uncharacterized protein n=1 Tax=Tanacetum coccineum TaxID=301880 RepID=A0ABQ5CZX6_9ASTR
MILPAFVLFERNTMGSSKRVGEGRKAKNDEIDGVRANTSMPGKIRVSESEVLDKGYDRFQKILRSTQSDASSQTMKNLRTFEIDVKGGSSYDSRATFTSLSSSAASSNVIEKWFLHSFMLLKSDPPQQITYEDFNQNWGKWIWRIETSNGTWQCSSIMKVEDVVNWLAQVYGMIAGVEEDATGNATGDVADGVSNAAAEFALMGLSKADDMTCCSSSNHRNFFMPPSNNPDLDDTQFTYGSKFGKNMLHETIDPPTSHYFQHFHRPGYYNQLYMEWEDEELLLSPQQVVLGEFKGQKCNGDPRQLEISSINMENPHRKILIKHEKNLIQVLKIHTDDNVADLLTKAFDGLV